MVANRRLTWNFALDRAAEHARTFNRPLVILEALRAGYPWAADRHHSFALAGMQEHAASLQGTGVVYHPYVEPVIGAGKGLVEALAARAALVVTDDFPAYFMPRMQAAVAPRLNVRMETVDSNGLLPLAATSGPFSAAYHFRRYLQKNLPTHLLEFPDPDPLQGLVSAPPGLLDEILERWPAASPKLLAGDPDALADLPIDHAVAPASISGGPAAAQARLAAFLDDGLSRYGEERNHPDAGAASGLSPYLHWGHLSVHQVFREVARRESWSPARLSDRTDGSRAGWWGMSSSAESFLDELVTWREVGFTFCRHVPDYDRYESLPSWARDTMEEHAADPREPLYTYEEFRDARTHDELWNAAQRELRADGVIHNYLRMLWGKKILEWSATPREALRIMLDLNNRYALDGRDPNSYTGVFWVMGRFDRGWPERPIFGKIRSMTSASTRRKVRLDGYLARWGDEPSLGL
jgi:deoxyribodipyrimidine photo-lyase